MQDAQQRFGRRDLLSVGLWFTAINTIFAVLISFRYAKYIELDASPLNWIYMALASVGHYGLLSLLLYSVILVPLTLLVPRRNIVAGIGILVMTLAHAILLIDTFVFDLFRFHLNLFVLQMLFGSGASQIFVFDIVLYLKATLSIACIIGLELFTFVVAWKLHVNRRLKRAWIVWVSVLSCVISFNVIHAWASAFYYRPIVQASRFYPLFYPLTANSFLYKHGIVNASYARERLDANGGNCHDLCYPVHQLEGAKSDTTFNILFILIDSWNHRTFCKESSPNINGFADSSLVFANHFSGSNGTRGGVFTLFYSLPALYWNDMEALQLSPAFLGELSRRGYDIKTFASASLKNPPFERTVFRSIKNLKLETTGATAYGRDEQLTKDWLHYADSVTKRGDRKPFFGFLFYDLPHAYELPKKYTKRFKPAWEYADYMSLTNSTDPTEFYNLYRSCVYYDDSLIGKVLEDLKIKHLLDNTIVVITGDHGQEFNENHKNFWGHNGNFTRAQVGVPLIIHWPGKKPQQFKHWTTHYDVVPTLLHDALGVTNLMGDYSIGKSLLDTTPRTWHIMGAKENFAIMYGKKLMTVDYNSSFEVTDTCLNSIPDASFDAKLVNTILKRVNTFYKKK